MALSELGKWGAVRKSWRPGERRDYFEPETNVWKLVQRVFRDRELSLVREVAESLEGTLTAIARVEDAPPETTLTPDLLAPESKVQSDTPQQSSQKKTAFKREQIEKLRGLSRLGEGLLRAVVDGKAINPSALRDA